MSRNIKRERTFNLNTLLNVLKTECMKSGKQKKQKILNNHQHKFHKIINIDKLDTTK